MEFDRADVRLNSLAEISLRQLVKRVFGKG